MRIRFVQDKREKRLLASNMLFRYRSFRKKGALLLTLSAAALVMSCSRPLPADPQSPLTAPTQAPIVQPTPTEDPLAGLTLEDKIGQMIIAGVDGETIDPGAVRMIEKEKIGGIILFGRNMGSLKGTVALVNALKQANAGHPAPLLIGVDQEGGKVNRMPKSFTAIPSNKTVGKTNDAEAAAEMGRLLAEQVKLTGMNMNFAPVLDINSNPRNPIIGSRSFGSTAEMVARLGIAEMEGIRESGIIPVVKHFPGHGDTAVDSHLELPIVRKSKAELEKLEWLPFEAAIEQQADAVMVAHILYPQLDADKPASLSTPIIGGLLRGTMHYDGVVMTDDLTMGAITKNYGIAEAAVASVQAGSDIVMIAHGYDNALQVRDALLREVKSGKLSSDRIDESVRRILALKQRYRLRDEETAVPDLTELNARVKAWIGQVTAAP
ncbi:beta-N-acetylhexosaminidase [Paenibacillus sp. NPDC058071]|uniref:beta-N-acetylhexosaminidase n=1 Tax=Paenibacillus sp. NPDC058071 TaxID=3346326 RepID=UPI0036D8608C